MARRNTNNDWFNLLCEVFTGYSAWLSIPSALLAFTLINAFLDCVAKSAPALAGLAGLTPVFGGSIAFVFLAAGLKAGLEKLKRKKAFAKQTEIESIRKLDCSEFELFIGESYRRMGFEVIEHENLQTGEGIDLKLRDGSEITLVQCKHGKDWKIGVKLIRQLHSAQVTEGADRAIFVTSGSFTQHARNFVIGKQIELIDGDQLCRWIQPTTEKTMQSHFIAGLPEGDEMPDCPQCTRSMLFQTVEKGPNHGVRFWSCCEFPRCRGLRQLSGPPA
jgi:restriction system protein